MRQLWDSWRNDDIVADKASGRFLTRPDAGEFAFHGSHFDVNGPISRCRAVRKGARLFCRPGCRRRGAILLPAMPTRSSHRMVNCPRQPTHIVTSRLVPLRPDATRVTSRSCRRRVLFSARPRRDAIEKYREIRDQQVTGQTALVLLEQIWNLDLSKYDPEGPLPDIAPDPEAPRSSGRAFIHQIVSRPWQNCARSPRARS